MEFKVKIDNIGKLNKANLLVRPLTVLAGPNNTGKSFFSKTLYSVFSSLNTEPVMAEMEYHLRPLQKLSERMIFFIERRTSIERRISTGTRLKEPGKEDNQIQSIKKQIKGLRKLFINKPVCHSMEDYPKAIEFLDRAINLYMPLLSAFEDLIKNSDQKSEMLSSNMNMLREMEKNIASLKVIRQSPVEKIFSDGFNRILNNNLNGNFQIPYLEKLIRDPQKPAIIDIEEIGKITIDRNIPTSDIDSEKHNFSEDSKEKTHKHLAKSRRYLERIVAGGFKFSAKISFSGFAKLQDKSKTIYLESPSHWKLRNALLRVHHPGIFSYSRRKSLLVPKYFNDLNFMLMEELSGDIAFPEIFERLTKELIKGKISATESGDLQFRESKTGKSHSLPLTATGIVQFGLLALLIEKKVLDKGTVLFIDEPETNLHPAWQVEMMRVLFELAKAGGHVILATHSVDMLKWLEVHLKNHPEDMKLISLNQMVAQEDGTASVEHSDEDVSVF